MKQKVFVPIPCTGENGRFPDTDKWVIWTDNNSWSEFGKYIGKEMWECELKHTISGIDFIAPFDHNKTMWLEEQEIDVLVQQAVTEMSKKFFSPEPKKRFTWKDLRDGKCAVEMPERATLEDIESLQELVTQSFIYDYDKVGQYAISKFYYASGSHWIFDNDTSLPSQPLQDFFPLED